MFHVLEGAAPNLCRTLPDAPFDKTRVEDLDSSCEDHAIDCARYMVMSVAGGSTIVEWDDAPGAALDGSALKLPLGNRLAIAWENSYDAAVQRVSGPGSDDDALY
jgi:hypothetical protein